MDSKPGYSTRPLGSSASTAIGHVGWYWEALYKYRTLLFIIIDLVEFNTMTNKVNVTHY
jgi:hypothetical protein